MRRRSANNTAPGPATSRKKPLVYNQRVQEALGSLQKALPSFIIRDKGRNASEESCVLIENGRFYGMGYLDREEQINDLETLREHLTAYPENDYMRGLVYAFAEKWPGKKRLIGMYG